jgi:hypothetical protein
MADPINMFHDPDAARVSFVELAFGLNIAFATYEKFRAFIKNLLDKNLDEFIAQAIAAETDNSKIIHQNRVNELKNQILKIGKKHMDYQWNLCLYVRLVSIVMSVACLAVLCFDQVGCLGNNVAYLISPLPIYVLVSLSFFWVFRVKALLVRRQYVKFIRKFEGDPPSDIQQGLDAL